MGQGVPDTMFTDPKRSRLSMLREVLDNAVTEFEPISAASPPSNDDGARDAP